MPNLTNSDLIGQALIDLPMDIPKPIKPKNVEIVKSYIDRNFGHADGWQITFNTDYTKIRKDVWICY